MDKKLESLLSAYKNKIFSVGNIITAEQANSIARAHSGIDYWNECAVNEAYNIIVILFDKIHNAAVNGEKCLSYCVIPRADKTTYVCEDGENIQLLEYVVEFFKNRGYDVVLENDDAYEHHTGDHRFLIKISWYKQEDNDNATV